MLRSSLYFNALLTTAKAAASIIANKSPPHKISLTKHCPSAPEAEKYSFYICLYNIRNWELCLWEEKTGCLLTAFAVPSPSRCTDTLLSSVMEVIASLGEINS